MGDYIPLFTAIISAAVLLFGYLFQKNKEREAEIRKKRQEIYSQFIVNLTERLELFENSMRQSDWPRKEDANYSQKITNIIINDPELNKNFTKSREINTFLAIYGSDDAINAFLEFRKQDWDYQAGKTTKPGDMGKLIQGLRQSIYPKSTITSDDLNLMIWKGFR